MKLTESIKNQNLLKAQTYINGKWREADNHDRIEVVNPASGEVISAVPNMGASETRDAITAADKAFSSWSKITAKERSRYLRKWYELIVKHKEDLAVIMTYEQGKPLSEALREIDYAASFVEWFAEEAKRCYGSVIPAPRTDQRIITFCEPIGVAAAITPWNFPAGMITRKVAPALAAGCTVVLKPSEETPLSALALAVLAEEAEIPAGVLNIVTGDAIEIGRELTTNLTVRKLSFTGSTEIGRLLMSQCASSVKRLSLELGGNAPFIVFDDADLELAARELLFAKYRNNGQTCICANRVLVHASVYDQFTKLVTEKIKELKVGNGMDAAVQQGPLISQDAVEKIERLLKDAEQKGAKIIAGGKRIAGKGHFFEPTLLVEANNHMAMAREEIFGPVTAFYKFTSEAEAITLANDTIYGLAAYFYTRDLARVFRVSEALEYGMVGVNEAAISNEVSPFGGVKQSGYGREGSALGIKEFQNVKYLCLGLK